MRTRYVNYGKALSLSLILTLQERLFLILRDRDECRNHQNHIADGKNVSLHRITSNVLPNYFRRKSPGTARVRFAAQIR
jgi:hypothetical protein